MTEIKQSIVKRVSLKVFGPGFQLGLLKGRLFGPGFRLGYKGDALPGPGFRLGLLKCERLLNWLRLMCVWINNHNNIAQQISDPVTKSYKKPNSIQNKIKQMEAMYNALTTSGMPAWTFGTPGFWLWAVIETSSRT
uniref:Uncharacterized protein n=1 Tax=Rhizophagus irregularis (strain DAOM 181602 / DAOM 197198 / MUCL 43194) TaxID=747089 RepID=U9U2I8_RHIID